MNKYPEMSDILQDLFAIGYSSSLITVQKNLPLHILADHVKFIIDITKCINYYISYISIQRQHIVIILDETYPINRIPNFIKDPSWEPCLMSKSLLKGYKLNSFYNVNLFIMSPIIWSKVGSA